MLDETSLHDVLVGIEDRYAKAKVPARNFLLLCSEYDSYYFHWNDVDTVVKAFNEMKKRMN